MKTKDELIQETFLAFGVAPHKLWGATIVFTCPGIGCDREQLGKVLGWRATNASGPVLCVETELDGECEVRANQVKEIAVCAR